MGLLIDGVWHDQWYDTRASGGRFVRSESQFRDWVSAEGGTGFKAEPGRYHLYVSLACPWAHRTLIFRALKGLEEAVSLSIVDPLMEAQGWAFSDYPGATPDHANAKRYLHEIYTLAKPGYSGRVSVPVLWDKSSRKIVNNESSEIIRMLNSAFDAWGRADVDFYPRALRGRIDEINALVYERINNGVYRAGFATTQAAYEEAFDGLFAALERIEALLSRQRYLVGERLTEAD